MEKISDQLISNENIIHLIRFLEEGMHKMVKNLYSDSILHKSTKDLAEVSYLNYQTFRETKKKNREKLLSMRKNSFILSIIIYFLFHSVNLKIKKIVQEKNRVGCGIGVCSNIKGPVTLYLVCKFNTKK